MHREHHIYFMTSTWMETPSGDSHAKSSLLLTPYMRTDPRSYHANFETAPPQAYCLPMLPA